MKIKKLVGKLLTFVILFSLISTNLVYAEIRESIRFNNLTIEDGLSQSTVETMFEDSRGYIWIGTNDGLNRYNGYEFKHYKNDKYNKNTIANNYIIDITEDKNGDMWISTSEGISRINAKTEEIKNYNSEKDGGNLSDSGMCQILSTRDNKIIAATEDGLNMYDEKKDKFYRILDKENDLPSQYIYTVREDSRGHIWVGTEDGLVEFDKDLKKLNTYEDTIGDSDVYKTYDDLQGHIWVSTLGNGLFKINIEDKSVVNYKNIEGEASLLSDSVKDTLLDSRGILWIVTDKGLCSLNYKKEVFTGFKKESYEKDSILDDKTRCLLKDNSGLVWVGCYSGISVFNPNSSFHHFKSKPGDENGLSGNIIYAIYEDNDKTIWIGTNENGVNTINNDNIKHLNKDNSDLIDDAIFDITGINNQVFIGTNAGLSVITKTDKDNFTIKNYSEQDGLPSNKIRSLFVDSKGYLFIGTNKGLAILDTNNGTFIDSSSIFGNIDLSDKFIRAVYEDSKGDYYIGCFLDGGLIKINPETKGYKIYKNDENDNESISNNTIRYITEDLTGNILVGTSHGINILDPNTDKFKHYTENDGLVNNTIYAILVDDNNDVWMSTNGGISKFSIKDKTFKNFTVIDGLQSNEFNGRAAFKSKDGYLYFGGINGFNVIDIDKIELSSFKPKVIFDSFEVNGIAKQSISNTKLKSNENNIKVSFFTNDYKNSKITKYYYRLVGTDDNWNVTNDNSLTFAKLPAGDYTLEVETITQHGVVSEISSVNFTVKPPLWRSKAAILSYIILIILTLYVFVNKFKALDALVNMRTNQLREQMDEN